MSAGLTEEQLELAEMLADLCAVRASPTAVRQTLGSDEPHDARLWRVLCDEVGAASLAIPEEFGGAGFTVMETNLVLEALGAALAPSPFLASVGVAAPAILVAGDAEASARLLPEIADGSRIATLAWAAPDGTWDPAAVAVTHDGGALTGEVSLVLDGDIADDVIVIAQTPTGPALFHVCDATAIERTHTPALDPTLRFARLRFAATPATPVGTSAVDFDEIRSRAIIALSAVQVGAAQRGLDMTVAYAKQRSQFGRLIGSYQALKHRMADMYVALDTARVTSHAAAQEASIPGADLTGAADLAGAWCAEALNTIASETIQLHGGIAITWEHDAHLVFKRAHATAQLFGTPDDLRRREAERLGFVA